MMKTGSLIASGIGVSPGLIDGPIRIVNSVGELTDVMEGEILVVKKSNPAWTVGMMKAAALICEVGGIICHAAIVAREMGIPCVVNVPDAVNTFATGSRVRVDGTEGKIYVA